MEAKPRPAVGIRAEAFAPVLAGSFVELDGEAYYRIAAFHELEPFLMTVPTDTDLWMFVTSGGGLTAGRVDPDGSIFPYLTVDQLHDAHHHTGPLTLIATEGLAGERVVWEPFVDPQASGVERNLYKSALGHRVVFEEIHHGLGLAFRYRWAASDEFGWVRTATVRNLGESPRTIAVFDGLRNVLPSGAPLSMMQQASVLVDAYKKSEVDPATGLGLFSLTSSITDRAEALEMLRANAVWCRGLPSFQTHLSLAAADAFRRGDTPQITAVANGVRGHYFVSAKLELASDASARWHLVADTGLDHVRLVALRRRLREESDLSARIEASLDQASEGLRRIVGSADGLQVSSLPEARWHHFANVLFNCMRGGVFLANHEIPVADLGDFLRVRNHDVARRQVGLLSELPAAVTAEEMRAIARDSQDADFERLVYEYLPLYFGRRHGDPSRPWNRFSIRARNRHGERELNYEGNWRDVFQNWEALGMAFPGFLPNMVAKFVNASTVDGFNPYRITRDGVDWEIAAPDDPWSNIGYWGDHQIVYLLRLLEALDRHDPGALINLLERRIFSYVDVPYRIKPYADLVRDPRATIDFDHAGAAVLERRVAERGTDGKLLAGPQGTVVHANLFEKLLIPALSKLSNLVPGAGIWMNTQRPEWNDANNALGGGGASVVTLCHLRRYLAFVLDRLPAVEASALPVADEVARWIEAIGSVLRAVRSSRPVLDARDRRQTVDALGIAFSKYREAAYARGLGDAREVSLKDVERLLEDALIVVDDSIEANRRPDGLYHTYNVLRFTEDCVEIKRLPLMLEGQVAVLDAGRLDASQALELVRALFASPLYAPQHRSFLLYPYKELPGFLEKNVVDPAGVRSVPLLERLLAIGDASLLERDAEGTGRFSADLRNAADVGQALDRLAARDGLCEAVERDRSEVLALFERTFHHASYTGRSGVMYGYEGIGCVYWHMVAKLLLAVQGHALAASHGRPEDAVAADLSRMYYRIRSGLGYEKTVGEFGAFPTDPYSHTRASGGAKQPGMTGQVKEEILARRGELGIEVEEGRVSFRPALLRPREFVEQPQSFHYFDVGGRARSLEVPAGALAFTFCQVPVVFERAPRPWIRVSFRDGSSQGSGGHALDEAASADLFSRGGRIEQIRVGIAEGELCRF